MASPIRTEAAPVQEAFEEIERWLAMSGPKWCAVVECRMNDGIWSDWVSDWEHPSHFRSESSAWARLEARQIVEKVKIRLGILEFRVIPKYLGYVPGRDETWIAD